jgi:hypothetical protein
MPFLAVLFVLDLKWWNQLVLLVMSRMKSLPAVAYLSRLSEATLAFSKQGAQQQQTSWYPKASIIFCMEMCPIGSCAAVSLAITVQSCLMSTPTFCYLNTMLLVLGWLL